MDVIEMSVKGEVDCKKPRLMVHTSESPNHHINGTINLSYQIVLQDHNYGAPFPAPNHDLTPLGHQCKQEPNDTVYRSGLKTTTPRSSNHVSPQSPAGRGQPGKANGVGPSLLAKRQRTSSGSNTNGVSPNAYTPSSGSARRPGPNSGVETPKSSHSLVSPPLIPKVALAAFPYAGDLNSRLYASASTTEKGVVGIKEEFGRGTLPTTNGSSGLSSYLSGNWCHGNGGSSVGGRSSMREIFKDDDSNCSLDSPRMGTESDREGEETETAPECEDEEDDRPEPHSNLDESVTRCICKFGHDDGYMICCDRCSVWQHVDCMNLDRNNIPDEFMCELCQPRRVDRARARAVQYRKRQEFRLSTPPPSGSGRPSVVPRRDKSKDVYHHSRSNKQEDYIDVEKTPKKFQRNNSTSTPAGGTGKVSRGGARNSAGVIRGDGPKSSSKRGIPPQPKFKRKSDKHDDVAPRKRKMFRKGSDSVDVGGPSSSNPSENSPGIRNSHPNSELLLQWIDHYEEAVTNHYSPELRARVSAVRPNGLQQGGDLPSLSSSTPAYRLASKAGGYKTLVASTPIHCGAPVIECRGKYMLASQLRPYKTSDGPGGGVGLGLSGLRPTPHIIFHLLQTASIDNASPSPAVEMCVDGRSYGNEARFVWQSCQPNAEVKHKVEKGSVHLYLIAKTEILDSEEITVAHDTKNPLPCPYEGCPHMKNKDGGTRTGLAPSAVSATTPTSGIATASTASVSPAEGERYKRRRRRTNSTLTSPTVDTQPTTPISPAAVSPRVELPPVPPSAPVNAVVAPPTPPAQSAPPPPTPGKRGQRTPSKASIIVTEGEDSQDGSGHNLTPEESENPASNDAETIASNKKKLSREERKMEAIMKAFERMEKAQQRRQESMAKTSHRKDSRDDRDEAGGLADHEADQSPPPPTYSSGQSQLGEKRIVMIGQETRTKSFKRGKRGGRMRRASSGAGISENSRIRMRALSGEVHSGHSATEEESEHGGSSSSPSQGGSHRGSQVDDAALLMTAFKCPKTKKVVFNDWSGDGSEMNGVRGDAVDGLGGSNSLPLSLSVPVCYMRNPNPRSPTRPFRTAHLRPSTLASLKSPAGSSSPDPHGDGGAQSNDENSWTAPLPGSGGPGGSAKKRWLRQAISEETETESPTAGGFCGPIGGGGSGTPLGNSGDGFDHVTPLKKRRLARASMSSETSFTPPSTPTPSNAIPGGPGETCGLSSEPSVNVSTVMEEVPSVESMSGENSQDTPPECNDPSSSSVEVDTSYLNATPTTSSPPQPLLEERANNCEEGPVSDTLQPSWTRSEESIPSDAELSLGPGEPSAANVNSQFQSLGDDVFSPSVSRPTWEFRAPDAQFMRQLSRNASDAMSTDSAVDSPLTETSVEGQTIDSPAPKPIKRKLSILEYRKRKQVLSADGSDVPKVDSTPVTTSATAAMTSDPSSLSTEITEKSSPKEESTTAENDLLNRVDADPIVQDSKDQQHLPPLDGLTADVSEAVALFEGKIATQ